MTGKYDLKAMKANAELAQSTIDELKDKMKYITEYYNNLKVKQLQEENAKLMAAVEAARKKLITLEVQNGIQQIPVPNQKASVTACTAIPKEPVAPVTAAPAKEAKPKKDKKEKLPEAPEAPIDVGRLDLRVGKIMDVERHPDADSLYHLKINCGEDKPRTVCSGLVKFIPMEDLASRSVVVLCNLKPVKMRGITSQAMVMCASTPEKVEVLSPPEGCKPGDAVFCDGYTRQPDAVMNPKKKIFETVAPDLHTNDNLEACYKGVPLTVPGKGKILSQTLKNVAVK